MKLIAPIVLALASTTPATSADAFSMIGGGGPFFTKQIYLTNPASMMMQRQRALANRFLDRQTAMASPRYELVDNDQKFQLSVDVPGVKMEDIDVSLEDGYLTVSGQRLSSSDNSRFTSKFSQTFSLDPSVDVESLSASLNDGVLVVSATKDLEKLEAANPVRKIPIMASKADEKEDATSHVAIKDKSEEEVMDLDESVPNPKEAVKVKKEGDAEKA